jgi:hypothetical protein
MRRLVVATALMLACAMGRADAQVAITPANRLTVTLVTFGLGAEVFERFGHDALLFHDDATGQDVAYHWGLFSFGDAHFIARFLTGDTRYAMGPQDARQLVESELRAGRPVTLQRLNLTAQQAGALRDFVRWNEQPENRYYRYDYFRDNCATRLRDALDAAVGGAIKRATDTVVTKLSYRRESVRLTDGDRPLQLGIDIALGRPADRPLTEWQSFFIPMRLRDGIRTIKVPAENGAMVPLVADERQIPIPGGLKPVEEKVTAPRLAWRYLALGLLLAALVMGLAALLPMRSPAWGLAFFGMTWSLLCGIIGVILLLAWTATRHIFWASNENVLLLTPLSLFLAVLFPAAVLSGKAVRPARMVAGIICLAGMFAAVLSVFPGRQENGAIVALFLPVHLALYAALRVVPPPKTPAA